MDNLNSYSNNKETNVLILPKVDKRLKKKKINFDYIDELNLGTDVLNINKEIFKSQQNNKNSKLCTIDNLENKVKLELNNNLEIIPQDNSNFTQIIIENNNNMHHNKYKQTNEIKTDQSRNLIYTNSDLKFSRIVGNYDIIKSQQILNKLYERSNNNKKCFHKMLIR